MRTLLLVLAVASLPLTGAFASSVPQQIQNKTIAASWVVNVTVVAPNGRAATRTVNQQRVIYVSSAGRIFVKSSYSAPYGDGSAELDPGAPTPDGTAREVRFENGKLVSLAVLDGGRAARMVVSFDQTFATCTVEITVGRSRTKTIVERKGLSFEILSQSVSGQSCTVKDGNAFANQ